MKREYKKQDITIIVLAVFLMLFLLFREKDKTLVKDIWYEEKIQASKLTEELLEKVKREKFNRNIKIDYQYDINGSGIIGVEFNGITTTLGALDAKRTSANPNFAAVMVDMMKRAGLNKGDNVAINFSSSFPAINLATLASCQVLDLNPIIITSIGSSTWGGNNLEFTYLDMENYLYKEGMIKYKSMAISPGGSADIGRDMNQDDLQMIINRMRSYHKEIIIEEELEKNIEVRQKLYYRDVEKIHGFINVGGNIVAFGNTMDSMNTLPGILKGEKFNIDNESGLVQIFYSKGVPTIHILNIKDIAHRYGLEIDSPNPYPVGIGKVYYDYKYPYGLILLVIITTLIILIIFKKRANSYD